MGDCKRSSNKSNHLNHVYTHTHDNLKLETKQSTSSFSVSEELFSNIYLDSVGVLVEAIIFIALQLLMACSTKTKL
jgi:hypothetical protein